MEQVPLAEWRYQQYPVSIIFIIYIIQIDKCVYIFSPTYL